MKEMEAEVAMAVQNMFGPAEAGAALGGDAGVTHSPTGPVPVGHSPSVDGANQVNSDVIMRDCEQMGVKNVDAKANLGINFHQCVTERIAATKVEATSLATDATFGKSMVLETDQVGSLNPPGDSDVLSTFHGARAKKNDLTVNQAISLSIDPLSMKCLACTRPHDVIRKDNKPVVIFLSDQNFMPKWPVGQCGNTSMIVVRLVNPTLHELGDLLMEVLDRQDLPDGSVVLVNAVSYLHRAGVGFYAREWCELVARLGRRWPRIRVGPLPPVIRENCNGGVAREVIELASWLSKVYNGSPNGFLGAWNKLVPRVIESSAGQTTLNSVEYYTVTLPSGLDLRAPAAPSTFFTTSSRPSVLYSIDQGTTAELVDAIAKALDSDFRITVNTGEATPASDLGASVQDNVKRVVLLGASNLKQAVASLTCKGYEVTDLCVPGWKITPDSISDMLATIQKMNVGHNTGFIFDLYGNSTTRAILFDGSTTAPLKGNGGYHLPGKVTVATTEIFGNLVDLTLPVYEAVQGSSILVLPPQPRYLFSTCCADRKHCTNAGTGEFAESLLADTVRLRGVLKRKLLARKVPGLWVTDTCMAVPKAGEKGLKEKLEVLQTVSAKDGVHLTEVGYANVSENLADTLSDMQSGNLGKTHAVPTSAALSSVTGMEQFFWRGFCSPVGCRPGPSSWGKSPKPRHFNMSAGRGSYGPYGRRGHRGGKHN